MSPFTRNGARTTVLAVLASLILVGVAAGCASADPTLEATEDTPVTTPRADGPTTTTAADATVDEPSDTDGADDPAGSDEPSPDASGTTPDTAVTDPPLEPTGLFLNTHELSLSGTNAPREGHSVCQTSPGATCEIRFLADGAVAGALPAAQIDSSGVVSWDWNPAESGLGTGTYEVVVVAARGGHEVTVTDARPLVVVD